MENYLFYLGWGSDPPTAENLDNWVGYDNPVFDYWSDKGYHLIYIPNSDKQQFYDGILAATSNPRDENSTKIPLGYYKQI